MNINSSLDTVAQIFKINEKTLRRWINKYKNNKLENLTQKKKSYKIKQKHVNYALKMLEITPVSKHYQKPKLYMK